MALGHSFASGSPRPSGIPSFPPKPFGTLAHVYDILLIYNDYYMSINWQ